MHSTDRILTTHVGSLIRPPELIALLEKMYLAEEVDPALFDTCLAEAVAQVVKRQAEVGIDIVSDGEFPKVLGWARYVLGRLSGVGEQQDMPLSTRTNLGKDRRDFAEFYAEYEGAQGGAGLGRQASARAWIWVIDGPLRYNGQTEVDADIRRLKKAMNGTPALAGFLPVVAPSSVAATVGDRYYADEDERLLAFADALHEEYKAIADAGLIVQIDDAFLASVYDTMVPPGSLEDYRRWAERGVEAMNHALRGIPSEKVRYHVCWGSWNGPHTNDVNARDIIDLVLKVNAGGYSLEMANPRHEHEWRVWESVKLPAGKTLLPGVIAHCTNVVEHPELVAERIVRLANLVGRENVTASTDCGFAQGPFGRRVHPSIQWAKLSSLVEGARLASAQLWAAGR